MSKKAAKKKTKKAKSNNSLKKAMTTTASLYTLSTNALFKVLEGVIERGQAGSCTLDFKKFDLIIKVEAKK
jgi:hypothetical protein